MMKKLQRGHCDNRWTLILKISHRRKAKVRKNATENIRSQNPNLGFERFGKVIQGMEYNYRDELCFLYHDQLVTF